MSRLYDRDGEVNHSPILMLLNADHPLTRIDRSNVVSRANGFRVGRIISTDAAVCGDRVQEFHEKMLDTVLE